MRMMAIAARRYHALPRSHDPLLAEPAGLEDAEALAGAERNADAPATHALEDMAESLVTLHLHLDEEQGGWRPFRLTVAVQPGWHLQAHPASEGFLIPTTVRAEKAELREVRYPEGSAIESRISDQPLAVYDGEVEITGELSGVIPGSRLVLIFQACDDARCLPRAERAVAVLPM